MAEKIPDDRFMELIAQDTEPEEASAAPSRLKARIYSALMLRQAEDGSLLSLSAIKSGGRDLCVFEQLVQIAPVGKTVESLNYCRVCHARILAEQFEHPPIYWQGCPYVALKNS